MANKNCEMCDVLMENVHHSKKYCDDCKKKTLKNNQNRHYDKYRDINKDKNKKALCENFKNVVKEDFHLTGKGFNTVSEIKSKSYTHFLDKKWIDILKDYNEYDNLVNYIVNSYKDFLKEINKVSLHEFARWNKYCTYDLLMDIGTDRIKELANITKLRYTDRNFINNFNEIINKVGEPPLYNEFELYTKIQLNTYAYKFKLKGKVYNELMKIMLDESQYEIYLNRYKNHKSEVGKETGILSAKFNDKDYEDEFHRVINFCNEEYGDFPSRRLFNELSNLDVSSYRRKYNKSWLEVCEMYGYEVERNHKSEKMLLNMIKDLTMTNYDSQKTWDWLIGVGGKHMYCDGFYPDLNLVIEFDGQQHRRPVDAFGGEKSFIRLQENDKLKKELLSEHNVKLIRIASNTKWYDKDYIQSILIENNISISAPTL